MKAIKFRRLLKSTQSFALFLFSGHYHNSYPFPILFLFYPVLPWLFSSFSFLLQGFGDIALFEVEDRVEG